jgi:hypothetical protein
MSASEIKMNSIDVLKFLFPNLSFFPLKLTHSNWLEKHGVPSTFFFYFEINFDNFGLKWKCASYDLWYIIIKCLKIKMN